MSVRNLSMRFPSDEGELEVLENIDLDLYPREFACLIGPSGSGKSTLLRILADVLEPTSGTITIGNGAPFTRAIVFQSYNLLPWNTVIQNIALPLLIRKVDKAEALRQAGEWVEKVGLSGFENEWPKNLSGGMAQRVAIARALIQKPKLLLLDEPFGALDALTREQMSLELMATWESVQTTVLMVTHSISEAVLLSDRILVFQDRPGKIVEQLRIPFERPRTGQLRDTPEFTRTTRQLRELIEQVKNGTGDTR